MLSARLFHIVAIKIDALTIFNEFLRLIKVWKYWRKNNITTFNRILISNCRVCKFLTTIFFSLIQQCRVVMNHELLVHDHVKTIVVCIRSPLLCERNFGLLLQSGSVSPFTCLTSLHVNLHIFFYFSKIVVTSWWPVNAFPMALLFASLTAHSRLYGGTICQLVTKWSTGIIWLFIYICKGLLSFTMIWPILPLTKIL